MSQIESTSLPADVTDDSCRVDFTEVATLTRDTEGPCTTECWECDSGDWSAEVKQQNLTAVKQNLDDVCYILMFIICTHVVIRISKAELASYIIIKRLVLLKFT